MQAEAIAAKAAVRSDSRGSEIVILSDVEAETEELIVMVRRRPQLGVTSAV